MRSTAVALGGGVAWAGPFEHLVGQDAWPDGGGWFPGLLLESLAQGGGPEASLSRAATLSVAYVSIAARVGTLLFTRRDVAS